VPDELTLLRDTRSDRAELSAESEESLRRALLARIAAGSERRPRRWRRRIALAAAVVAVVAVSGVLVEHGGEASVAARAYAAITRSSGVMHFVVEHPGARARDTYYAEYWIDLAHPRRQRIVYTREGLVDFQWVLVTYHVPYGTSHWSGNNKTKITHSTAAMWGWEWGGDGGILEGQNPVTAYRALLRAGTVRSERETTYHGRDAYELVVQFTPPYDLVDDVWTGSKITYIVDRHTYFPLESTFQDDPTFGGSVSDMRFPKFEILPDSPQAKALLKPQKHPSPYRP
jgi:hypothetical protein